MSYVGRRPLALAIRAYRRWLSGRGPLRRTSCTFASTESCSAYGLRAVEDVAQSLPEAIGLVRARVRTCRRTSIYRFENGLGWERDHELPPAELAQTLAARGERADTIAQVIAARMTIAKWRGERDVYRRVNAKIPVRPGDAAIRHHHRTMRRASLLVLASLALMLLSFAAIVPAVMGIAAITNARGAAQRLEQQRVAAKFLRPSLAAVIAPCNSMRL